MHDDDLWDGSGPVDPDVAALQRVLAPLRYEAEPLRLPRAEPRPARSRWSSWALPVAASAAAAALVLAMRGDSASEPSKPVAVAVAVAPVVETPASMIGPVGAPVPAPQGDDEIETPPLPVATRGSKKRPKRSGKKRVKRDDHDSAVAVDCILDPALCQPLLEKLSSSEIRKGILPVKGEVQACAKDHEIAAGTRMKVKMYIRGATGRVSAATAMAPWSGTALGDCVERAVSRARFPRFKKERLGVVYPFTLSVPSSAGPAKAKPRAGSAVIREEMNTMRTKARACAVAHDIASGTRVELSLKIAPRGAVESVKVDAKQPVSSDAERCLTKAIGKIEFPPSDRGVHGRIPIML